MPIVPYYLGRPACVWIAAMAKRGMARQLHAPGQGRDLLAEYQCATLDEAAATSPVAP